MGEPITVYDKNGKPMTVYGRAYANELIAAGQATAEPQGKPAAPAADEEPQGKPEPRKSGRRKGAL